MPGADGQLWPADQLVRADALTVRLVTDLGLGTAFLDRSSLPEGCDRLAVLCAALDLQPVLTRLTSDGGPAQVQEALGSGRVTAASFLTWLRRDEKAILANADLRAQVRALPIYPTQGRHRPLGEVVLPGGFTDRLGIAEAIDTEQIRDHITFLQQLGATPLTLRTYLTESVPRAAQRPEMLTDPRWEQLIADLAVRLDQFAKDPDVQQALTPLPLVPCGSGAFLPGSSCYFPSKTVTAVLGPEAPVARPLPAHERSTTSLYEWLGAAAEPRMPDVVARARRLADGSLDPQARQAVAAVIGYLGKVVPDRRTPAPDVLSPLRDLAWLPARGDLAWRRSAEVHTVFREKLFATQGRFLDIPLKVQQDAADFLHWLGVETIPSVSQIVTHLLTQARLRAPVSRDVYTELNRNAADPSIERLAGTACLQMPVGGYAAPTAVFRQDNPFGRFRQLLGPDFDAIGVLLDRLGVKRIPDHHDARDVLTDIAREQQARFHLPVEYEDDLAVIWQCWRMLDEALARDEVGPTWFAALRSLPVIPNAAGVLTPPARLLIDDMPGVAAVLNIGDAVIRRKEGMWRAFQAAGVRSLTEAVGIEILQMQEMTRDGAVRTRMDSRRPALARVLDASPDGIQRLATALEELSFPQSPILGVRYHLPEFGLASAETALKSLYIPENPQEGCAARLISCPQDGTWPWMLIAKEFARALYPGEAPGPLASSLYIALNAASLEAAHSALDDAGWPRLEYVDIAPPDAGPGAGFIDHDSDADWPDRSQPDNWSDAPAGPPGMPRSPTGAAGDQPPNDSPRVGNGAPPGPGSPAAHHDGQHEPASTEHVSTPRPPADHTSRRAPHGRLRSYVTTGNGDGPGGETADTSPVDQAGVRRVVEVERAAGRRPEVMPHDNPGFDVISRDESGRILRHIEVKSTSSAWDDMGVGLSRTQFDFAMQHRDTFWLYVVEHALDDERARVLRIADPAGRAEEFRFDGGWSAVSEAADADPPVPDRVQKAATTPGES